MADYYSILKKTVGALPENNGAARRGVYSRARTAIVKQLKAYEPPLSPSEITAEQLRLEEAIRKVEAEAARESLGLSSQPSSPSGGPASARSTSFPAPPVPSSPISSGATHPAAPAPRSTTSPAPSAPAAASGRSLFGDSKTFEPRTSTDAFVPYADSSTHSRASAPSSGFPPAKPASYGGATKSAEGGDFGTVKTSVEASETPAASAGPVSSVGDQKFSSFSGSELGGADREADSSGFADQDSKRRIPILPIALVGLLILIVFGIAGVLYSQKDTVAELMATSPGEDSGELVGLERIEPTITTPTVVGEDDSAAATKIEDRVPGVGGAEEAAPDDYRPVATTVITPGAPVDSETPDDAPAETVTEDTTSESSAISSVTPDAGGLPVSDNTADTSGELRSILYEEGDETNSAGTAVQGTVSWKLLDETNLSGVDQKILVADVVVPERDVSVSVRIKQNDDKSLPASHLVEIKYDFPEGFAAGDVVNVPGLVMKPTEEARGDALIGASVKVSPGYFWIALSNITSEAERNIALLRDRGWIDIPMLYSNGRRGILTLEKGSEGMKLVEQAIAAWNAS
ncbi:MAG: hypothetical protein HWE23_02155 [Rhodobacteraceae bacterium]|nr:hypothetical protein [Paracoccaceae bacterium]